MRGFRRDNTVDLGGDTGFKLTLYLAASYSAAFFICSAVGSSDAFPQAQKLRLAIDFSYPLP